MCVCVCVCAQICKNTRHSEEDFRNSWPTLNISGFFFIFVFFFILNHH